MDRLPIIPHADFGKPDCCGCLYPIARGGQADIVCNECGTVVRTVATDDLTHTLDGMELAGDVATALCPHCGAVHLAPGFSRVIAFVCAECGHSVCVPDA